MPGPQVCHNTHDIGAAIVRQAAGNDLKSIRNRAIGVLPRSRDSLGLLLQPGGQFHLCGTAAREHAGLQQDVPRHAEGVLQVALHLVEHIPGRTTQDHRARLRVLALSHEGEILVADLLDLEEATLSADHGLYELLSAVANMRTCDPRDAIVVCLSDTPNHRDVGLQKEVLRQVRNTLLGDDHVGLHPDDIIANLLHLVLLLLQQLFPI
mmetsp:Transcript_26210/g.73547  ORF Transcript_26210/g.73547 Transcript_26210/m.73547 type:complete len:209 (+) Transcript_26210:330-956(+)